MGIAIAGLLTQGFSFMVLSLFLTSKTIGTSKISEIEASEIAITVGSLAVWL